MIPATNPPIYLRKSAKFYRISGLLFLFSIATSVLVRPLLARQMDLVDLIVGLPIFAIFILSPMGLYYTLKSYKNKESQPKMRLLYLFGHLFFCLLILLSIAVFISDISQLF